MDVIHGDCLEVLRTLPDNSFDSLLTDPPAGIAFMGKDWDKDKKGMLNWINWLSEILTEANRVMKPGAIGLVWSIPRTSHWTGMAIELAGFRIIDILHHANGSGFPKSQDIGKLIDNMAGAEREVVGRKVRADGTMRPNMKSWKNDRSSGHLQGVCLDDSITAPATPEAKQWDGWKTPALKPAIEGWWLIQKKCSESSIARNILKHGVGGLNIEAGRIGTETRINASKARAERNGFVKGFVTGTETEIKNYGRYPANLVLSCGANCEGNNHSPDCPVTVIGDHGSTARYFKQLPFDPETVTSIYYQAKASKSDRTCGGAVPNVHPTVKSRHLMGYFLKLITPPGGIVLDPFGGSGTTAVAAIENGFSYCLIEKEEEYIKIINDRIAATQPGPQQRSLF